MAVGADRFEQQPRPGANRGDFPGVKLQPLGKPFVGFVHAGGVLVAAVDLDHGGTQAVRVTADRLDDRLHILSGDLPSEVVPTVPARDRPAAGRRAVGRRDPFRPAGDGRAWRFGKDRNLLAPARFPRVHPHAAHVREISKRDLPCFVHGDRRIHIGDRRADRAEHESHAVPAVEAAVLEDRSRPCLPEGNDGGRGLEAVIERGDPPLGMISRHLELHAHRRHRDQPDGLRHLRLRGGACGKEISRRGIQLQFFPTHDDPGGVAAAPLGKPHGSEVERPATENEVRGNIHGMHARSESRQERDHGGQKPAPDRGSSCQCHAAISPGVGTRGILPRS